MAKDVKITPARDPISNKVLRYPPNYPAGKGVVRPASPSIDKQISAQQRREAKPSR